MSDVAGIAYALGTKAAWRREKAEQYPEDGRNMKAAEMLEALEAQVSDADPELMDEVHRIMEEDIGADERFSEILTDIGFHRHYTEIDQLLRAIVGA